MTYPLTIDVPLGEPYVPLAAQLYGPDGAAVGAPIVGTGFHETPPASGYYSWTHNFPVGFRGRVVFQHATLGQVRATVSINPSEVENPYLDLVFYGIVDDPLPDYISFLVDASAPSVLSANPDHYIGGVLFFTTGDNATLGRKIADYDPSTGRIMLTMALRQPPTTGDRFVIVGRSE